MKKTAKAALALILSLVLVCSLSAEVFAGKTLHNINDAAGIVQDSGGLAIYKAILHKNNKSENIYYVLCPGVRDWSLSGQANSYGTAIKIALSNENNSYLKVLVSEVKARVPKGAKVVFAGHSMGGMAIQQAMANKELKNLYEIVYATAFGAPYIITSGTKEGTLYRMADKKDSVPYMSLALLANPLFGNVAQETSGFKDDVVHDSSYRYGECWKKYDCLGVKNGGATIELLEAILK